MFYFNWSSIKRWFFFTNHKETGTLCLFLGVIASVIGTVLSLVMRFKLAFPGDQVLQGHYQLYNVLVTAHALVMLLSLSLWLTFFWINLYPTFQGTSPLNRNGCYAAGLPIFMVDTQSWALPVEPASFPGCYYGFIKHFHACCEANPGLVQANRNDPMFKEVLHYYWSIDDVDKCNLWVALHATTPVNPYDFLTVIYGTFSIVSIVGGCYLGLPWAAEIIMGIASYVVGSEAEPSSGSVEITGEMPPNGGSVIVWSESSVYNVTNCLDKVPEVSFSRNPVVLNSYDDFSYYMESIQAGRYDIVPSEFVKFLANSEKNVQLQSVHIKHLYDHFPTGRVNLFLATKSHVFHADIHRQDPAYPYVVNEQLDAYYKYYVRVRNAR